MQSVQEEWYESLHDWEAALRAYETKQYQKTGSDMKLTLGKMRCLEALGEWYNNFYLTYFVYIRIYVYTLSAIIISVWIYTKHLILA